MSANLDVQMRASYEKAPSAVMVTVCLTPRDKIINERANKTATQKQTGRAIRKIGERVKNVNMFLYAFFDGLGLATRQQID